MMTNNKGFFIPLFFLLCCINIPSIGQIEIKSPIDTLDSDEQFLLEVEAVKMSSNMDTAQVFVEEALLYFHKEDDILGEAIALKVLAYIKIKLRLFKTANRHLNEAIAIFDQQEDVSNLLECSYYKSLLEYERKDYVSSGAVAKEALRICEEITCQQQGLLLEVLFKNNKELENIDAAEKYSQLAIAYYDLSLDSLASAIIHEDLADMYQELESYPNALSNYKEVLAKYESLQLAEKACSLQFKIGLHYKERAIYDKAQEQLAITKECTNALGLKQIKNEAYSEEGLIFMELKNYKTAIQTFKQSIRLRQLNSDRVGQIKDLILTGKTYQADKDFFNAKKAFDESVELSNANNLKNYLVKSYSGISDIYLEQGKLDSAILFTDKALEIVPEVTDLNVIKEFYELGTKIYEKKGAKKTAEKFAKEATTAKEKLEHLAKAKEIRLAELRTQLSAAKHKIGQFKDQNKRQFKKEKEQIAQIQSQEELIKTQEEAGLLRKKYIQALSGGIGLSLLLLGFLAYLLIQRKKNNEQLQIANSDLAKMNKELKESESRLLHFAHSVAHDLKNPINSVLGFSELLKLSSAERLTNEEKEYLDDIESSSLAINSMVEDLQKYATVGSNLQATEHLNLSNIILEVQRDLSQAIRQKKAIIEIYPLPNIQAHPTLIRQLFQNLIGNAVKYGRDNFPPNIKISVENKEGQSIFQVADNGIGIPKTEHTKIFDLFNRVAEVNEEGSGIGLALCQRIVEIYGGKLWLESEEHKGSTFYFTLPKSIQTDIS